MRSTRYRGRHREPNTTTSAQIIARSTAGATAFALPIVGMAAPAAHAATENQWDRVAKCESGGNWHINTGTAYSGGLLFPRPPGPARGGGASGSRADLASR